MSKVASVLASPGLSSGWWTDEEHKLFEKGVDLHGWGQWTAIAGLITTRTNKQVKSHAQKIQKRYQQQHKDASRTKTKMDAKLVTKTKMKTKMKTKTKTKAKIKTNPGQAGAETHDSNPTIAKRDDREMNIQSLVEKTKQIFHRAVTNSSMAEEAAEYGSILKSPTSASDASASASAPYAKKRVSFSSNEVTTIIEIPNNVNEISGAKRLIRTTTVIHAFEQGRDVAGVEIPTHLNVLEERRKRSHDDDDDVEMVQCTTKRAQRSAIVSPRASIDLLDPMTKSTLEEEEGITREGEEEDAPSSPSPSASSSPVDPALMPYVTPSVAFCGFPSNYDVLCGSKPSYANHIGNRRFRIMVEMRLHHFEPYFMASCLPNVVDKEDGMRRFLDDMMIIFQSCSPPCRFLALDRSVGMWRLLNDSYVRQRIEQAFHECMVARRAIPV